MIKSYKISVNLLRNTWKVKLYPYVACCRSLNCAPDIMSNRKKKHIDTNVNFYYLYQQKHTILSGKLKDKSYWKLILQNTKYILYL